MQPARLSCDRGTLIVRSEAKVPLGKYHLHEGEEVIISSGQEGILLKHPPSNLRGFLRGKIDLTSFEEDLKRLRTEWRL